MPWVRIIITFWQAVPDHEIFFQRCIEPVVRLAKSRRFNGFMDPNDWGTGDDRCGVAIIPSIAGNQTGSAFGFAENQKEWELIHLIY